MQPGDKKVGFYATVRSQFLFSPFLSRGTLHYVGTIADHLDRSRKLDVRSLITCLKARREVPLIPKDLRGDGVCRYGFLGVDAYLLGSYMLTHLRMNYVLCRYV